MPRFDPLCSVCKERCSKRGSTRFSFEVKGRTLWRCQTCEYESQMGRVVSVERAENPLAERYLRGG